MLPIVVKDFKWRQTDDCIIIQTTIKTAPKNVDLLAVDNYVKAHYKPFILELFLWDSIEENQSSCIISDNELIFTLKKVNCNIQWPSLETSDLTREMKKQRRNSALELAQSLNEQRLKKKTEKRHCLRRKATQAQMDLHTDQLNKIEAIRDSHRIQAMNELDEWSKNCAKPCIRNEHKIIQENRKSYKVDNGNTRSRNIAQDYPKSIDKIPAILDNVNNSLDEENKQQVSVNNPENLNTIWDSFDSESDEDDKSRKYRPGEKTVREIISGKRIHNKKIINDSGHSLPLPRKSGTIDVTFSERVFVTPARESFKEQEEEWLVKQAKARRNAGFIAEDLKPEEQDPQWCLDKGEDFMKVGNYLGAISAFSHGIKLNDQIESLYIMRSASQYACGNYHRCIEDTTKALELMLPECEANKEARARCYARRGAALCQLSAPQHGLPEMEAALKLLPNDTEILADIQRIKNHFNLT